MTRAVQFSPEASDDLLRIYDFILKRELQSATGDLDIAQRALRAIQDGLALLTHSPFACRKVGESPFLRELVIPFGRPHSHHRCGKTSAGR
jgi:plasmid stabilization system protein ParE